MESYININIHFLATLFLNVCLLATCPFYVYDKVMLFRQIRERSVHPCQRKPKGHTVSGIKVYSYLLHPIIYIAWDSLRVPKTVLNGRQRRVLNRGSPNHALVGDVTEHLIALRRIMTGLKKSKTAYKRISEIIKRMSIFSKNRSLSTRSQQP